MKYHQLKWLPISPNGEFQVLLISEIFYNYIYMIIIIHLFNSSPFGYKYTIDELVMNIFKI